jgi:hypothetical protein
LVRDRFADVLEVRRDEARAVALLANRFTAFVCPVPHVHDLRVVEDGRAGYIAASILPIRA